MGDAGLTKLRSPGTAVTSGMARSRGSRVVRVRLVSICWFCLPGRVMGGGVSAPRGPLAFRFMCSQSPATPVEGQLSFPVVLIKVSGLTLTVHAAELSPVARGWKTPRAVCCLQVHTGARAGSCPQAPQRLRRGRYSSKGK